MDTSTRLEGGARRPSGPSAPYPNANASGAAASYRSADATSAPAPAPAPAWSQSERSVVRNRQGSVLTRGLVLKTDHFAGARPAHLSLHLQGAPNFRKAACPLEVYGVAQPTITGLRTILSVLQCQPGRDVSSRSEGGPRSSAPVSSMLTPTTSPRLKHASARSDGVRSQGGTPTLASRTAAPLPAKADQSSPSANPRRCVWVCTREEPLIYVGSRPFVLREADRPTQTFGISGRSQNLEAIEQRLKADIIREAGKYGGLLMVHEEQETDAPLSDERSRQAVTLTPTWVAVDASTVKTAREIWTALAETGWAVEYHRIPIASSQPPEASYLDAYTSLIRNIDPTNTSFVANCGVGFTRTTFAMVAAVIVRRKQLMLMGQPDPFGLQVRSAEENESPYEAPASVPYRPRPSVSGTGTKSGGVLNTMRQIEEQDAIKKSLLRLVHVVSTALSSGNAGGSSTTAALGVAPGASASANATAILFAQPALLSLLSSANAGDYGIVRQLTGLLDDGLDAKAVVDAAIDSCAHVTNLREAILLERIRHAVASAASSAEDSSDSVARKESTRATMHLHKASASLEKYFFLVAFSSYVSASKTAAFEHRFASWLRSRAEIWHNIRRIREKSGMLYLFDPISDLSGLTSSTGAGSGNLGLQLSHERALPEHGTALDHRAELAGDEFAEHVVRTRTGIVLRALMLLKLDIWRNFLERANALQGGPASLSVANGGALNVRGTVNFRRIPRSNIFAMGQPTIDGIRNVLHVIAEQYQLERAGLQVDTKRPLQVTWLNLREEPLVYINSKPYCLRQSNMSLRNIKEYSGISWTRLTLLEDRLKNDVLGELAMGEGRLLLHTETNDGSVVPVWEEIEDEKEDIETIQEVMDRVGAELETQAADSKDGEDTFGLRLVYRRIPITAEKPPDFADLSELLTVVLRAEIERCPIILNCQLGRGRSTLTAVCVLLIQNWLADHRARKEISEGNLSASTDSLMVPAAPSLRVIHDEVGDELPETGGPPRRTREPLSYHIINSLLRVIPKGLEVKRTVDEAIDRCAAVTNLRDAIEDARLAAEDAADEDLKRKKLQAGIHNLRRYFELLVFQSYLSTTTPSTEDDQMSFEAFVRRQPVFHTIAKEFDKVVSKTITPLRKVDAADGMALDDEVAAVVSSRNGSVLSVQTILKSDFFSGIVKLSLPDKIDGIPNLRGVSLLLGPLGNSSTTNPPRTPISTPGRETWGSGMPTVAGLRKGLQRIGATPEGGVRVVWTSLREEPVLYVNGRPHVLRLADQPLTNVEATGVTTDVVERMETALKADVLTEAKAKDGRVLLHDEVEVTPGQFEIIPVWETVAEGDVLTPREVYELIHQEGYQVDYARVAVTDEQAPVPVVFSELEERVSLALRTESTAVFNCQMGRGRTTTGMVIASLVSTVRHYGEELVGTDMDGSFILTSAGQLQGEGDGESPYDDGRGRAKDRLDDREDELWLQGEYRSILQLVGVLSQGRLAKKLTDKAIDRMEAVQNLRKAIYDSKLRAGNADPGSKKRRHLQTVYLNYLQRYGYLIAFANYILEKAAAALEDDTDDDAQSAISGVAGAGGRGFPTFVAWLKTRREITHILDSKGLA